MIVGITTTVAPPTPRQPPAARPRPAPDWARWAALAAAGAGGAVRLELFATRRSLWLDEALVANNIVARSFVDLLHPLAGQQGAPIGWLWAERAAVIVFGENEFALRLLPLVAGIAALALVYRAAGRLLGPVAAALTTALLALSPFAVRYSVEVKQYSSDMAIALLLVLLALDRRLRAWAVVGVVAVWCSHPAVFVLAGGATVMALDALRRRSGRELAVVVAVSAPWLASFGADWMVSLRKLGANSYLHHFWAAGLAPSHATAGPLLAWTGRVLSRLLADPGGLPAPAVVALVAAAGWVWAVRRRPFAAGVVAVPAVVGFGAAAIGAYPLEGRMALWLLPAIVIGLAAAAAALLVPRPDRHRATDRLAIEAVAVLTGLVLVVQAPVLAVVRTAVDPPSWVDMRSLLQAMAPRVRPGDHVWVHDNDAAAAAFYARSTGVVADGEVWDGACPTGPEAGAFAPSGRVWFVYGYQASTASPQEAAMINRRFATTGRLLLTVHRPGATAWLWSTSGAPDRAPLLAALACLAVTSLPSAPPTGLTTGPLGSGRRT